MRPIFTILVITFLFFISGSIKGQEFQYENIGRGVVAVVVPGSGIYIGWRLLAIDPDSITFNVYRGETKINEQPLAASTNFIDTAGTVSDSYTIVPVIDDVEQEASQEVTPWSQNYMTVPLDRPTGGTTPDNVNYTYSPNDASVGDLDGDGEYEIVLKWDPSNSKDNSQSGYTGNVYLDAYEYDGTHLWRINLGINIRAGAHYTQFMVYDLDGDGKAEIACKTAPGTKDASGSYLSTGPADGADHAADYRNTSGYILSGPEYFTVFNGETGLELETKNYNPPRGELASWGDTYGNRVDRFLAGIAYVDGEKPSVVMCRGYYRSSNGTRGRTVLAAWDYRGDSLHNRWTFNADMLGENPTYTGQGYHSLSVADVDQDGKDEIVYGSMAVDDDGSGLWNSNLGHGDALHVSDIDINRLGLEVWGIHEQAQIGSALLDAKTGEIIWGTGPADVGRGVSANLDDTQPGMECWGGTDGLRSANNEYVGPTPSSTNHVVWWDGDLARELLNSNYIQKYGGGYLLTASGCSSNNGSKSNPCLQADLLGDWREEVIWRTSDNQNLRIYTTTDTTSYRIPTLMHDRQYRLAIAWQNVAYNQPPHTSFYVGHEMFIPDSLWPPSKTLNVQAIAWDDTVQLTWDANSDFDLAGYKIYRGISSDSLSLLSDVGTATTYLDTNVTNDSTYYYAVAAYDIDNNESIYSDIVFAIPTIRPATPTGISYRFDTNSIFLIWDSQDLDYISRVNIYRSFTDGMSSPLLITIDKSLNTYVNSSLKSGTTYYFTISVTDTNEVESFPTEILSITPGSSFTFQSEDASLYGTVYVDENHLGFHGTAFTNFDASNSAVEFTNMPGFGGGDRTLIFRYALGNTNRTGNLIVNGTTQNLTMQGTGDWVNWVYDSVGVTLNTGYDNTIRFAATGSDFGNLDEITIVPRSMTSIDVSDNDNNIPTHFQLYQNFPNPFNPETKISFDLPKAVHVSIMVYDINGRLITRLVNGDYQPGTHTVKFGNAFLSTGIYIYRIQAGDYSSTKKMILLR